MYWRKSSETCRPVYKVDPIFCRGCFSVFATRSAGIQIFFTPHRSARDAAEQRGIDVAAVPSFLPFRSQLADIRHRHRMHNGGRSIMNHHDSNKRWQLTGRHVSKRRQGITQYADQEKSFAFPPVRQTTDERQHHNARRGMHAEQQPGSKLAHPILMHV